MRVTGKYAYVDGIGCTQMWSLNESASVSRYTASCTPDGTGTTEGNIDRTGSIAGLGYLPPFPSEDEYAAHLVASQKVGDLLTYDADILFSDATLNIPVAAGGQINWSANFGVNGAITKDIVTAYADDVVTPAPAAKLGKIAIEGTPDSSTYTDVAVQNVVVTFRRPHGTEVVAGLVERAAGNLEVDLSFDVKEADLTAALYATNATKRVKVFVTDTLFYLFDAITFREKTGLTFDTRSQEIVGFTVNGYWTALRARAVPGLGQILLPGGASLWPA